MMTLDRQIIELKLLLDEIKARHGEIVVSEQYEAFQIELDQTIERLSEILTNCEYIQFRAQGGPCKTR